MPTLRSIARDLGLSPSTVSLALNDSDAVSGATRERVRKFAQEVGYRRRSRGRPSAVSQLSIACFHAGALKQPGTHRSLIAENLAGIRREARHLKLHLRTFDVGGLGARDVHERLEEALDDRRIDGMVLLAVEDADPFSQISVRTDLPIIALNRRPAFGEYGFVEHDNFGGAVQAAEEILRRGCTRPALVTTAPEAHFVRARGEGFRRRIRLDPRTAAYHEEVVQEVDHPFRPEAYAAEDDARLEKMLERGVDAIFGTNFFIGLRFASAAERLGVEMPARLSVVAFDRAQVATPGGRWVSSIGFDSAKLGRLAVRLIAGHLLDTEDPDIRLRSFSIRTRIRNRDT